MMQQVNFYSLLPKPAKYQLTPTLAIQAVAGFAILLVVFYLFNLLIYFWQTHTLTQLQKQQKQMQQQLIEVTKDYELNSKTKPILWQNQQLSAEIKVKQATLEKLQQMAPMGPTGYTSYLLAFANAIVPGVWLTDIYIDHKNQIIELSGKANANAAIMQFIQNLDKETILNGRTFSAFHLENVANHTGQINFKLNNKLQAQNGSTTGKNI